MAAGALERAVEDQQPAALEQAPSTGEQPLGHRPGGDVDEVGGEDGIGPGDRPGDAGVIEVEGRAEVGSAGVGGMGVDAGEGCGVGVGRLPDQRGWQARRHEGGMLAAAGSDLEEESPARQDVLQDRQDRLAIAQGRGGVAAGVGCGHRTDSDRLLNNEGLPMRDALGTEALLSFAHDAPRPTNAGRGSG